MGLLLSGHLYSHVMAMPFSMMALAWHAYGQPESFEYQDTLHASCALCPNFGTRIVECKLVCKLIAHIYKMEGVPVQIICNHSCGGLVGIVEWQCAVARSSQGMFKSEHQQCSRREAIKFASTLPAFQKTYTIKRFGRPRRRRGVRLLVHYSQPGLLGRNSRRCTSSCASQGSIW